MHLGNLNK